MDALSRYRHSRRRSSLRRQIDVVRALHGKVGEAQRTVEMFASHGTLQSSIELTSSSIIQEVQTRIPILAVSEMSEVHAVL